jgi:hypothetical protein
MMVKQEAEIGPFAKFVEAIDPWLGETVLVGGWAHPYIEAIHAQEHWIMSHSRPSMEMSPFRQNSRSKNRQFDRA